VVEIVASIEALLPAGIGIWWGLFFIFFSMISSAISATTSIGGGTMMLAIFSIMLPQTAVVPVHGITQLGSNLGRFWLMREYKPDVSLWVFSLSTMFGVIVGGMVVQYVPPNLILGGLGVFILWSVWGGTPRLVRHVGMGAGGFVTGICTMFVSATGPLVGALLREKVPERQAFIAVHSGLMSIQHVLKLVVFGILVFDFLPYIPLLVLMLATGFLGSFIGKKMLMGFSDVFFGKLIKVMLSLAALRAIWAAFV